MQVLSAGRTSVVTDPSFDPAFYRLGGYRLLGRRAVRIDILERLADLIRPALGWKPGTGTRPDGAYDGTRFVVTPSMMSILGATADDMEEILKSLGYRPESVEAVIVAAKLTELDTVPVPADPVAVVAATSGPAVAEEENVTPTEAAVNSTEPSADGELQPEPVVEVSASADEPAPTVVQTVAEEAPKPILLWRQARFDGRNNRGHQEKREHHRGGQARSVQGEQRPARNERDANQQNEQGARKEQFRGKGKPNGKDRFKQGDNGKSAGKPPLQKRPEREERPVKIDMDSPFAKLLALKEQMKK